MARYFCFLLAFLLVDGALSHLDTSQYERSKVLNDNYKIYWSVRQSTNEIALAFEVRTLGWFGFGITEPTSGSMPGADVMVVQEKSDGSLFIEDRWTNAFRTPNLDDCTTSDWKLVSAERSEGKTYVEVVRSLTARDAQDRDIVAGDNAVILAWGDDGTKTISYHGSNRLATVACFWDCPPDLVVPDGNTIKFRMPDTLLPAERTTYLCYSLPFETPAQEDAHVIEIHQLSDPDAFMHHLVVHLCEVPENVNETSLPALYSTPDNCISQKPSPTGFPGCKVLYVWAQGSRPFVLPPEAGRCRLFACVEPTGLTSRPGFRIRSTERSRMYFILDMHYDNPNLLSGVRDSSGVEVVFTTELRKYDASTLAVGDMSMSLPPIPPGVESHAVELSCPAECTSQLPYDLHVFADFFHMHMLGSQALSTHHRNEESSTVLRVEHYVFNHQLYSPVNITIKPGDRINTHCVWDSRARTKETLIGFSSTDEMCMEFLAYYPAVTMSMCGFFNAPGFAENQTMCGTAILPVYNPAARDPEGSLDRAFGLSKVGQCPNVEAPAVSIAGVALPSVLVFLIVLSYAFLV